MLIEKVRLHLQPGHPGAMQDIIVNFAKERPLQEPGRSRSSVQKSRSLDNAFDLTPHAFSRSSAEDPRRCSRLWNDPWSPQGHPPAKCTAVVMSTQGLSVGGIKRIEGTAQQAPDFIFLLRRHCEEPRDATSFVL